MSAPHGNTNALKSGLTASRHHLTLGNMPKKLRKVQGHASALRRELEAAVVAVHGEITLLAAARIQTAVRLETTCQLARRWLMEALSDLSEGERLAYLREIGRASIERDRVLQRLGLDANETTTLEALYDAPASSYSDDEGQDEADAGEPTASEPGDDAGTCDDGENLDAGQPSGSSSRLTDAARDYTSRVVESQGDAGQGDSDD